MQLYGVFLITTRYEVLCTHPNHPGHCVYRDRDEAAAEAVRFRDSWPGETYTVKEVDVR